MSWQSYVDDNLIGTGKVQRVAILGQAGGIWAASQGYNLPPNEQKAIVNTLKNLETPANVEAVQRDGIRLSNQKFFTIYAAGRSVYGKKGADGCVLVKTTQAVLVAEYIAPTQQPEAVSVVEGLADYLISVGY